MSRFGPIIDTGLNDALSRGLTLGLGAANLDQDRLYRKMLLEQRVRELEQQRQQFDQQHALNVQQQANSDARLSLDQSREGREASRYARQTADEDNQRAGMVSLARDQGVFNPPGGGGMGPYAPGQEPTGSNLTPDQFGALPSNMQSALLAPTIDQIGQRIKNETIGKKRDGIERTNLSPRRKKEAHAFVTWHDELGLPGTPPMDFDPGDFELVKRGVGENSPQWKFFVAASQARGEPDWGIYDMMVKSILTPKVVKPTDPDILKGGGDSLVVGGTDAKGNVDPRWANVFEMANGFRPDNLPGTGLGRLLGVTDRPDMQAANAKAKALAASMGISVVDPMNPALPAGAAPALPGSSAGQTSAGEARVRELTREAMGKGITDPAAIKAYIVKSMGGGQ